jgi:hypothetical protein
MRLSRTAICSSSSNGSSSSSSSNRSNRAAGRGGCNLSDTTTARPNVGVGLLTCWRKYLQTRAWIHVTPSPTPDTSHF